MTDTQFDIAVIGGGPGGYVAAIRAAQLGLKPVVIERENLGGICLNWGCIPTKALLRAAELRHSIDEMADFGITVGEVKIDLTAVVKRSRKVAARLSIGCRVICLKKNKVTVFDGRLPSLPRQIGETGYLRLISRSNARPAYLPNMSSSPPAPARAPCPVSSLTAAPSVTYRRDAMVPETMPESLIMWLAQARLEANLPHFIMIWG